MLEPNLFINDMTYFFPKSGNSFQKQEEYILKYAQFFVLLIK